MIAQEFNPLFSGRPDYPVMNVREAIHLRLGCSIQMIRSMFCLIIECRSNICKLSVSYMYSNFKVSTLGNDLRSRKVISCPSAQGAEPKLSAVVSIVLVNISPKSALNNVLEPTPLFRFCQFTDSSSCDAALFMTEQHHNNEC